MRTRLQTVVETPAYLSTAKGLLSDSERDEVVNTVAKNPEAGVSPAPDAAKAAALAWCSCSAVKTSLCSCSPSLPKTRKRISAQGSEPCWSLPQRN